MPPTDRELVEDMLTDSDAILALRGDRDPGRFVSACLLACASLVLHGTAPKKRKSLRDAAGAMYDTAKGLRDRRIAAEAVERERNDASDSQAR